MTTIRSVNDQPGPAAGTLKPCPFCGAHATAFASGGADFAAQVQCGDCNAATDCFGERDEAIAAWNRRVTL